MQQNITNKCPKIVLAKENKKIQKTCFQDFWGKIIIAIRKNFRLFINNSKLETQTATLSNRLVFIV